MNCTHPFYAVNLGLNSETGKFRIRFLGHNTLFTDAELKYGEGSILPLPCGKCLACKVNSAKEWSIRCMLEASLYNDNYFLTLTYDDEHKPDDNKISKSDIQLFMKKLRYYIPGCRFFCCGEYGSLTKRPHYHLILFNCKIPDIKFIGRARLGGSYLDSKLIRSIWSKGNITIGEVTPNSCEYVARYCMKKINGDEFLLMSNRPGIGANYFQAHVFEIYDTDGVYVKGRKYPVPRYFDKLFERDYLLHFLLTKEERAKNIRYNRLDRLLSHLGMLDEGVYAYQARCDLDKYKNKMKGVL